MKLIGTISSKDDQHAHISAEADTYEEAKAALYLLVPDGQQLIAIRAIRGH